MGSGSYVDLVVIKPKDDVQYLRTFDEANVKVYLLILSRKNSNLTNDVIRASDGRSTHTPREQLQCSRRKSERSR